MKTKSKLTIQHPGKSEISTLIDTKGYVSETAERVIELSNENERLKAEAESRNKMINKFLFYAGSDQRDHYLRNFDFDFKSPEAEIQAAAILGYSENMRGLMVEAETKNEAGVSMMCSFAIKTSVKYAATLTASKEGD